MGVKKLKFKVLKRFEDRFTHEVYEEGADYLTKDKDRALFMQKEGYLGEEVKKKADKK